ncbi:MAG TPA: hypothetical protein VLE46_10065 [Nitrospira sp.]|nr:hypothetical protein [Nitrospira sp.]
MHDAPDVPQPATGETDDAQQKRGADEIARRLWRGAQVVNKVLVEP